MKRIIILVTIFLLVGAYILGDKHFGRGCHDTTKDSILKESIISKWSIGGDLGGDEYPDKVCFTYGYIRWGMESQYGLNIKFGENMDLY